MLGVTRPCCLRVHRVEGECRLFTAFCCCYSAPQTRLDAADRTRADALRHVATAYAEQQVELEQLELSRQHLQLAAEALRDGDCDDDSDRQGDDDGGDGFGGG